MIDMIDMKVEYLIIDNNLHMESFLFYDSLNSLQVDPQVVRVEDSVDRK